MLLEDKRSGNDAVDHEGGDQDRRRNAARQADGEERNQARRQDGVVRRLGRRHTLDLALAEAVALRGGFLRQRVGQEEFEAAANRKEIEGLLDLLADDFVLISGKFKMTEGIEAMRE